MNFYVGICIGLLFGLLLGGYSAGVAICWALKQKQLISDLLNDAYHVELLPEICRVEGLIVVALAELRINTFPGSAFLVMYLEKALECIQKHKKNVMDNLEKYHS